MDEQATVPYAIGADVVCSDGTNGTLIRVIVDPVARSLTHLVVEASGRLGPARLVPVALVAHADPDRIALRCDGVGFEQLEDAVEFEFVPASREHLGYPADQARLQPYVPLGTGMVGAATMQGMNPLKSKEPNYVRYERVPLGEVPVRRGERVQARDGEIGRVQGLVVDPQDNHVTHVLLQEGHLWGKKQVAIPITAVLDAADGIEVDLDKEQVRSLPAVDLGHPER